MKQLKSVALFMATAGQPILKVPCIPFRDRCELRHKLTEEENNELKEAYENEDVVEVFDALLDKLFVTLGDFNEFGMAHLLEEGFEEVVRSNMSKFCKDEREADETVAHLLTKNPDKYYHYEKVGDLYVVKDTETGKVQKSINYSPADLKKILVNERGEMRTTVHED